MIGVDWGTTGFRAFRLAADGSIRERIETRRGILTVDGGRFADVLRDAVGPWLADGEDRILLCGMIGSRQGWREAPYVPVPAGAGDLAKALLDVDFPGAQVGIVPGVSALDTNGVPEVMRGEETQIVGAAGAVGTVCLPGSHSKWAQVRDGRITGYATHLTGEAFAALRDHTILGRMMQEGPTDPAAFARGVARSGDAGGVLHHLFGVRTLGLTGQLTDGAAASYLSGLLIGHEVRAALPQAGGEVLLIGAAALCALYARAVEQIGGQPRMGDQDAAASGLTEIGRRASWN